MIQKILNFLKGKPCYVSQGPDGVWINKMRAKDASKPAAPPPAPPRTR